MGTPFENQYRTPFVGQTRGGGQSARTGPDDDGIEGAAHGSDSVEPRGARPAPTIGADHPIIGGSAPMTMASKIRLAEAPEPSDGRWWGTCMVGVNPPRNAGPDPLGPDPYQCHARGVMKGGEGDDYRQGVPEEFRNVQV
jgi:hypothetical protein